MTQAAQTVAASAREALGELQKSKEQLDMLITALDALPTSAVLLGKHASLAAGHAAGALKACTTVAVQAVNLAVGSGMQTVAEMIGDELLKRK